MNPTDFNPQNVRFGEPIIHANGATTFSISYCASPLPPGQEGPEKEEPLYFSLPVFDFNAKK